MRARNYSVVCVETGEKTKDGENVFCKAFAKNFLLTSKSCSWQTFHQMDFMKS